MLWVCERRLKPTTETTLCTVDGGQHCGNYETFGIPSVAWQMFQTQKLP